MVDRDWPHVVDQSTLSCWSSLLCLVLSHFRQHPFLSLSITLCVCSQCLMGVLTWIPPPFPQHHLVCLFSVFDECPYSGYPLPSPSITLCVCSQCLMGVLTWIPPPSSQHHLVCLFSVFDECPYSGYPLPSPSIALFVCSQCLMGVLTVDTPSLLPASPCVSVLSV